MKKGLFIVLEGGEGSGKSSAVRWLKDELASFPVVFTREPGGVENAEEIREVILRRRDEPLDTLTHLLLFEAARREHMTKKIFPALEQGMHVICDRFSASTYAYQIVASGGSEYEQLFLDVDARVRASQEPDLTIFLDLEPAIGIARKVASEETLNAFDEQKLAFHQHVRMGIKKYLESRPHVIIDASQLQQDERDAVKSAILNSIETHA